MRKIKILKVNATSGVPGSIEISGDFSQVFQGKFYRNAGTEATAPFYTTPIPAGSTLIRATTFDIVENAKYNGRYTVYTPVTANDTASSFFGSSKTTINVNEVIVPLVQADATTLASDGYVTNISTYLLYTGTSTIVVPPAVDILKYPVEFMGRDSTGWGEGFAQNFLNITRNFASPTPPENPFVGQQHFDTDDGQMRVFNGASWSLVNQASYGVTFKHTQGSPAAMWTVNHGLGLAAPFIAFTQFFVDRGNGPQIIIPSNVEFLTANQIRVTFSNPEIGYVLVRQ